MINLLWLGGTAIIFFLLGRMNGIEVGVKREESRVKAMRLGVHEINRGAHRYE